MFLTGIRRSCRVSNADTRHLVFQHDNHFAEPRDFCLSPFNHKFRHIASGNVNKCVYANTNGMKAFEIAITMAHVEEDLTKADNTP